MTFFDRLHNGWDLGLQSIDVIKNNKTLIFFPIMSTISTLLIFLVISTGAFAAFGFDIERVMNRAGSMQDSPQVMSYVILFIYYLINFTIVTFFNVALVYCARDIFNGYEVDHKEGIAFALSRIGNILSWAMLAATVGIVLKIIEERVGVVGAFIVGIIGVGFTIASFFVIPVLVNEDVGPVDALKRSMDIVKEKWGESIGANFSFGVFYFLGALLIAFPIGYLAYKINPIIGISIGLLIMFLISIVITAAQTVFLTAVYQHVNDRSVEYFQTGYLDGAFRRN